MKKAIRVALLLLLSLIVLFFANPSPAPEAGASSPDREELDLNGTWDIAVTGDPAYPPRVDKWRRANVPGLEHGNAIAGTRYVWYRREVKTPESFRGKRIDLVLHGARFNASVYVNGVYIGSRLEGFTPFSADLTERLKTGSEFVLEIRCQDWSAVFKDDYRLPADANPNGETLRGVPRGKVIAPIGGHFYFFGIWDDVTLEAKPRAHCADVTVRTSVRDNNTITVTGEVSGGRPDLWVEGAVYDGEKPVLSLPGRKLEANLKFKLAAPLSRPRYWSPEDPHLYSLTLTLKDGSAGAVLDRSSERFGFRELWAVGPDFYLNGIKRHLLATSTWPQARYQSAEDIRRAIADLKSSNAVAFRLHTQPWQRAWLEQADEAGLMIVEEGALWCDGNGGYAYDDERFWDNVWTHLQGMVRRDRNRPSLVMWSIENEILHCGAAHHCACAEDKLADMGRRVKALDPTHLITYEADHDPGGAADVIGLHYPREMPENTDYPNTADWLGDTVTTGTAGGTAGSWNKDFFWDRKKPLYIGEYLWVFQQDYSPGSVFFGDEAYRDRELYRNKAKARAWEIQTAAYRRAGVSGMCPWTVADEGGRVDKTSPLYAAQKNAYEPVGIYPREYDTRFFINEKVIRTFDVFNDTAQALRIEARVSLTGWVKGHNESFTLEPAGHRVITVTVPLPDRPTKVGLDFSAGLYVGGKKVHSFDARIQVHAKTMPAVPGGCTLLVYDPNGAWLKTAGKLPAQTLKTLAELEKFDPLKSVLVVGPIAWSGKKAKDSDPVIGLKQSEAPAFRRFLSQGGRAIILEQDSFAGFMPELVLVNRSSTMTFPASSGHPLIEGLAPEDLKFWRGDHRVTLKEIRRPERLGGKAVVVSGGLDVVAQAPIVEIQFGRGRAVFCQALAGAKYDTEPTARRIVANAIRYLAASPAVPSAALLLADGKDAEQFRRRLDSLGLVYATPDGAPAKTDLEKTKLLILHGGGKKIEALAPLLEHRPRSAQTLTVYWHAPEPESFASLKTALGLERAEVIPAAGPLVLAEPPDPVMSGVLREDVCLLKPFAASNWYREVDLDLTVIDRALGFTVTGAADRFELETWALAGHYVQVLDNRAAAFYTNGMAAGEIETKREGLYQLTLLAWGTPAQGGWPVVTLKANGRLAAQTVVTAREPRSYLLMAPLPKGKVKLELIFDNDLSQSGEDRNLFLDSLGVSQEPIDLSGIALLSLPTALVSSTARPGLRVVVDCLRWDTTEINRVKGARFASTMFANLGASFAPTAGGVEWIDPPSFAPVGNIAAFNRTDAELGLASAGTVKAAFTCAGSGAYEVFIRGRSTPAQGVYAKARLRIDGKVVGEPEIASLTAAEFLAGSVTLATGTHEVSVEFTNDVWLGPGKEDRNLYVNGVGFILKEE